MNIAYYRWGNLAVLITNWGEARFMETHGKHITDAHYSLHSGWVTLKEDS